MRLVMTLLVRDAEALLRENVEFHRAQGVDFFVITDNRSTDRTGEIARAYARRGLAEVIDEPGDDYSQSRWVTRMARRAAAEHGADWVINNDDDEFWHAPGGAGLKPLLAGLPADVAGVLAQRCNHPPLAGGHDGRAFFETMIYRETRSLNAIGAPLPPKLCHRGDAGIAVAQGNARASHDGRPIVAAIHPGLRIAHFPIRDHAAFERKIRIGGAAYARNTVLDPDVGRTWRELYALWQAGGLRAWYDRQTLDPAALARGLDDGSLVLDETVRRVLRAALATAPATGAGNG